jgi:hypothetical protein
VNTFAKNELLRENPYEPSWGSLNIVGEEVDYTKEKSRRREYLEWKIHRKPSNKIVVVIWGICTYKNKLKLTLEIELKLELKLAL